MHHPVLITEQDWFRDDVEDILSIFIAEMVVLRIKNGEITETVFAFKDEESFSESTSSLLLPCGKRLKTRPALISHRRRKPHLIRLDDSKFGGNHCIDCDLRIKTSA
jgi:hypothetical protein